MDTLYALRQISFIADQIDEQFCGVGEGAAGQFPLAQTLIPPFQFFHHFRLAALELPNNCVYEQVVVVSDESFDD
jgi:hypothetical protein